MRQTVAERAGGFCEYCRSPDSFASDVFEAEHIFPQSLGGLTAMDNLAWACGGCNLFKSNKTQGLDTDSGKLAPLFHPRKDEWNEHFTWSDDFTKLLGISAIGRATIHELRINRPSLVNLRTALLSIGQHPPA